MFERWCMHGTITTSWLQAEISVLPSSYSTARPGTPRQDGGQEAVSHVIVCGLIWYVSGQ